MRLSRSSLSSRPTRAVTVGWFAFDVVMLALLLTVLRNDWGPGHSGLCIVLLGQAVYFGERSLRFWKAQHTAR